MEKAEGASSEKELLELRNEGKITEDEYQDLLAAMQKKASPNSEAPAHEVGPEAKRILGLIAFVLMLAGIILPALSYAVKPHKPNAFLCFGLFVEIPAFIVGIIARKDPFGKAAAITAGLIIGMSFLVII